MSGAPFAVIEHVWIAMPDGCRLSARLWLPDETQQRPVPAILEYIPYRKRDGTRLRDEVIHGYFAQHGYAALRVDMRGSGESEGLLHDEYLPQEQDDAVAVIAWIAAQPWCDGAVGMVGKSWGGFNALQVAARRPPALKAIATVYSTDDRYADDIHFSGGCLLNDNLWWGAVMLAYSCRPPDPAVFGPGWREAWLQRLEALPFFSADWLEHQRRDAFWAQGSVCEDFSAIRCPVLAVGGWADGYTDAVFRLLEGLDVPRAGLIGPWAHVYPHDGVPGPAIDFLAELVRWWDRWLKGAQPPSSDEPMLKVWRQEALLQPERLRDAAGGWISVESWPPADVATQTLSLAASGAPEGLLLCSPQTVGAAGGEWCGFGVPGEAAEDQRMDETGSVVVTTPPLAHAMDLLGQPVATLRLAAEAPCGLICVRLSQVLPTGEMVRLSYGLMNLARRDGPDRTTPLVAGEVITVEVPLHSLAYRIAAGARLHIAISTSYWPMVWPSPDAGGVRIFPAECELSLPLQPSGAATRAAAFAPPIRDELTALAGPSTMLREGCFSRRRTIDEQTGLHHHLVTSEGGLFGEGVLRLDDTGTVLDHAMTRQFGIDPHDPLSARHEITQRYAMGRPGWSIVIETRTTMVSTASELHLDGDVVVMEGQTEVFRRRWRRAIVRDGV